MQTRFSNLEVIDKENSFMYAVINESQLELGSELICSTRPWHRSSFLVLVGQKSLFEELKSKFAEIKDMVVPEMENVLNSEITGYFFPLDEELVIHGSERIHEIINGVSTFEPN